MAMASTSTSAVDRDLVTLPLHLRESIASILATDLELPADLRAQLDRATATSPVPALDAIQDDLNLPVSPEDQAEAGPQATIPLEVLENLSRWAGKSSVQKVLRRAGLDPSNLSLISLLAGTEIYIPPSQLARLKAADNPDAPNPFLPSYLSPKTPSFGTEYRALTKQLTTILNILFSIFGSAFAVYIAAITGAGYSRERGIVLGVLAGGVVGLADGVLVWVFSRRVKEGREISRKVAARMARGTGKAPELEEPGEGEKEKEGNGTLLLKSGPTAEDYNDRAELPESSLTPELNSSAVPAKRQIRLRRRPIGETDT